MIDLAALRASLGQLANGDPAIQNALNSGVDLSQIFFGNGSLGRSLIPENITGGESERLHVAEALARQNPRLGEQQAGLNRLNSLAETAGNTTPDIEMALNAARSRLDGLTPEERQVLVEQGNAAINSTLATAMRAAQIGNMGAGRIGAGAGISASPAIANALAAQRGLQRDIGQYNIGLRDQRLGAFSDLARGVQNDSFQRALAAATGFSDAARLQRNADFTNSLNAQGNAFNMLQGIQNRQQGTRAFNLNQLAREKSGQIGSIFGAGEFGAAQQGRRETFDLGQQQIQAMGSQVAPPQMVLNVGGGNTSGDTNRSFSGGAQF